MFWKRKSEAVQPSRAEAARAASLDQARPVPILKPATPSSPVSPVPIQGAEMLIGSTGSIRFAGSPKELGSPASTRSHSASPQRSPLPLQTARLPSPTRAQTAPSPVMPLYQAQPGPSSRSAQRAQLPAVSTHNIVKPQSDRQSTYGYYPHPPSPTHPAMQRVQAQSSRRSSRPASPSTTSFGARLPYASATTPMTMPVAHPAPTAVAPVRSHSLNRGQTTMLDGAACITTPPTAYCSANQSRAAPPSPCRRASDRAPIELMPAIGNSLFDTPSAPSRHSGQAEGVPMLNIIPATPQAMGEEWGLHGQTPRQDLSSVYGQQVAEGKEQSPGEGAQLAGAFAFGEMMDVAFAPTASVSAPIITLSEPAPEGMKRQGSSPELDELQFSPFEGRMVLPKSSSIDSLPKRSPPANLVTLPPTQIMGTPDTIRHASPPLSTPTSKAAATTNDPLPSPPFDSYGSLPSLDSERSMPSSGSSSSLRSSSSLSSLNSYPDVEEALGSMLASLSDPSMPLPHINSFSKRSPAPSAPDNAGLGLGLALGNDSAISLNSASAPGLASTAPLSLRRKAPPAPLDLTFTNLASHAPVQHSAPPRINHRVAFYSCAKAAPNSPHSGMFTQIPHSASGSVEGHTEFVSSPNPGGPTRTWSQTSLSTEDTELSYARGERDSMSLTSELSDDDLHTASIVCLTPVRTMPERDFDYAEEHPRGYVAEVGVAL